MAPPQPRTVLKINTKPFSPSLLSLPPSPHSPRIPLTPPLPVQKQPHSTPIQQPSFVPTLQRPRTTSQPSASHTAPLPSRPGSWTWTCHQCHRSYRLSATHRCLYDGHVFCSGRSVPRTWRTSSSSGKPRAKRHRACTTEFDYFGWNGWGIWRRNGEDSGSAGKKGGEEQMVYGKEKRGGDCWNQCDYPSHCIWGNKCGVASPQIHEEEEAIPKFYIDATSTSILEDAELEKKACQQGKKSCHEENNGDMKKKKRTHIPTRLSTIAEEEEEEDDDDDDDDDDSSLDLFIEYIESHSDAITNSTRASSPGIPDTPFLPRSPDTTSHIPSPPIIPPAKPSLRTLMYKALSRRDSCKRVCSGKKSEGGVEIHGSDVDFDIDMDMDMFPPLERVASHEADYLVGP